ncbi:MarR family transcriptional regulator [Devosia sp. FKR38]|uniref:MarR family winged helix-turn-helix transcriptional regulator n=1 Tax=Devosia sp. FKR38 TaxID=2562312 RepID=UPI001484E919|nr:MarR family transcriptional regulator [Devosia sp. FKR38]
MAKAVQGKATDVAVGAADAADGPVPSVFGDVIGYHLRLAQEASFAAFSAAADKAGLKPGWYTILTVLAEKGPLTPSDLGRLCGRDRSTLTSTLKGLASQQLIVRERKPEDQRSYSVQLTAQGRLVQDRLRSVALDHDRRLDGIVGKDKQRLVQLLAKITQSLSSQ